MMATAGRPPPSVSSAGLLAVGWTGAIIAGVIFFSLAWNVATYAPLVMLDGKVASWLHKHGTPEVTAFMLAVTTLHSITGTSLLAIAFGAVLARMRERYWVLTLALAMGGGLALNSLLKQAYARVRPYFEDPWVTLSSYSFPSGHTAGAVLFYGVLCAFLVSRFHAPRQRIACVVGGILAVVLVAFSRMYLGAHYLSDVAAAACSSLVWLVLCLSSVHALLLRKTGRRSQQAKRPTWRWIIIGLAVAALAVALSYVPVSDWVDSLERRLECMNLAAALAVFCVASVLASLLLAPAWIFQVAAGGVFGMGWGIVAALASSLTSAVIAFLAARHLFRGRLEKWARGHSQFKAFDRAVSKDGWKVVALLRLSPVLASGLKSYFFGLTRIPIGTYAFASLVGMLPGILLKVYLGDAGRDALKGGPLEWALVAAGILATIALSLVVRRLVARSSS